MQNKSYRLMALMAATATAQTVTSTIPVCPTAASTTITIPTTVTFCPGPHCNGGGAGPQITPPPYNGVGQPGVHVGEYTSVGPDGKTTVLGIWETVFDSMGENGLVPATYTITEECPCTATPHATVMPQGFETTVVPCSVCGPHSTVTLTQPCPTGPYATQTPSTQQPAAAAAAPYAAPAAASAAASAGASASAAAQAGPAAASGAAGSNSGANAAAAGPGSAAAAAKSGADSSAQAGPNGASAQAGANSGASANSVSPVSGMKVAPVNGTAAAVNGTKPVAPIQSYVSSGSQASIAVFAIIASVLAALLL